VCVLVGIVDIVGLLCNLVEYMAGMHSATVTSRLVVVLIVLDNISKFQILVVSYREVVYYLLCQKLVFVLSSENDVKIKTRSRILPLRPQHPMYNVFAISHRVH
jgi:hypothetical protein